MERLTFEGNFCDIALCTNTRGGSFCEDGYCSQRKVWERLKYFEDLQEQGRLAELPCKVGDAVYETSSIFSILKEPKTQTVKGFSRRINNELVLLCDNGVKIRQSKINRTVFLTQAEAQAALERMEGKK